MYCVVTAKTEFLNHEPFLTSFEITEFCCCKKTSLEIVNHLLPSAFIIVLIMYILGRIEKIICDLIFCVLWFRLRKTVDLEEYSDIIHSYVNLQIQNKSGNKDVLCT